jgi:hypothetical protein
VIAGVNEIRSFPRCRETAIAMTYRINAADVYTAAGLPVHSLHDDQPVIPAEF